MTQAKKEKQHKRCLHYDERFFFSLAIHENTLQMQLVYNVLCSLSAGSDTKVVLLLRQWGMKYPSSLKRTTDRCESRDYFGPFLIE